jgi:putative peptidoglycan lipid II flippase
MKYYTGIIGMIAAIKLLLAVLALLKDSLFASYMGTNESADALLLAFFICEMIGSNLIADCIGTNCLPLFAKLYSSKGVDFLYKYILKMNAFILSSSIVITISIYFFRYEITNMMGKGFSQETGILFIRFLSLFLLTIPLFSSLSIGISANQAMGNFAVASFSSVLFNFVSLIGIIYCIAFKVSTAWGAYIIAVFMLCAIGAMVVLQYFFIHSRKEVKALRKRELFKLKILFCFDENIAKVLKQAVPYFLLLLVSQITLYVERGLASGFGSGSISALNYGYRLSQFPTLVFVAAIGTVTFPLASAAIGEGNVEKLKSTYYKSIKLTMLVSIPMSIFLFLFRKEIIKLLFFRGAFDINSVNVTAQVLMSYSLGILGESLTAIGLKFFLALGNTVIPLSVFFISAIINVLIDYLVLDVIGISALGLGASVSSLIRALAFHYILRRIITSNFQEIRDI